MALEVTRAAHALADAAARLRDADFPARVRATRALRVRTGYTEPVIDYALDALFGAIDATTILATIAGELGELAALGNFVARAGRPDVAYMPLARAAIVSSDTTIGVALPPLLFALCAGCRVDVKERDDGLIRAFIETLADESPELAARATARSWHGTDDAAGRAHVGDVDVALAFGGDAALVAIRAMLRPGARFVGFGHRTSVGYVTRDTLATQANAWVAARAAARDALLYDGDGCLSSHAVLVESGAAVVPSAFAAMLAEACASVAVEFPAGYAARDPALTAYLRAAEFRASQGRAAVYADHRAPHAVTFEASHTIAPPLLRRTVACFSVDGPDDALAYVRRHALPLEGIAFSTDPGAPRRADLVAFARACGASRVAPLGDLQRPPLNGEHGGEGRIRPFVRAIYRA